MNLDNLRREIRETSEARVRTGAPVLERRLRDKAPVGQTGQMRDKTTVQPVGLRATVRVAVDYASYVVEGTEPHPIVARNVQALRFYWPAVGPPQPRFYRQVMHPGTQPNDWYHPVLQDWPRILETQQ